MPEKEFTGEQIFYRLGLIGEKISHSVSPIIHQTLLAHTELRGDYGVLDVSKEQLPDLFQTLQDQHYRGVNVTVPHKQSVPPFLDELSPSADVLQAVNTIIFEPEKNGYRLVGHNTDVTGFWQSVPEKVRSQSPGSTVLLLGAGGAARAVLAAILPQQPGTIIIAGQSPERLRDTLDLAQRLNEKSGGQTSLQTADLSTLTFSSDINFANISWVINATPVGTGTDESPLPLEVLQRLPNRAYVSDLVYHPRVTQLMKLSQTCGLASQNGLSMLIHQAMAAFMLWTGADLDEQALERVASALDSL